MIGTVENRSLGTLFSDLVSELGMLVRQELALAKVEIGENVKRVGQDVAILAIGGAVLYAGFLALVATMIVGLALVIGSLLAATAVVTIVVLAIGYFLVRQGLDQLKQHDLTPRQSIESLNVNVDWAKEQFR